MPNYKKAFVIVFALSALSTSSLLADDSVVVFNEILYNPHADADIEWIEFHNLFAFDVDVSKWSLRGGVEYTFPEGTIIPAKGYLVVTDLPAVLGQLMNPDFVHGPFGGNLSNSGERLTLYNNDNRSHGHGGLQGRRRMAGCAGRFGRNPCQTKTNQCLQFRKELDLERSDWRHTGQGKLSE